LSKAPTLPEQFSINFPSWTMDSRTLVRFEMDIPQSEDEARAHIAEIRAAKSLDDEASETSDLENALVM
jgi:hypothetical protein